MISLGNVCMFLIRKQKYTVLYLLLRKMFGPSVLNSRYPLLTRCAEHLKLWWKPDYFYDPWELC